MVTQLASLLISTFVGCCIGYLYGLLFIYQKKGALFNTKQQDGGNPLLRQILLTVTRFSVIAFIIWYLLLLPKIHFILMMMSFFTLFWIVIIRYKGPTHE